MIKVFSNAVQKVQIKRNRLAHGIWFKVGEQFSVRALDGKFQAEPGKMVKRKIKPEGIRCTVDGLKSLIVEISEMSEIVEMVITELHKPARKHSV